MSVGSRPNRAQQVSRLFFALGHRHDLHHHRRHVDVVTLIAYETDPRYPTVPKNKALSAKCEKNQTVCRTPVNTIKQQHLQVRLSPLFHGFMFFSKPPQPQDSAYGTKQHTHQSHIVHQGLKQTAALLASASEQKISSLGTAWALGHPGPITLVQQVLNDLGNITNKTRQNHGKNVFQACSEASNLYLTAISSI